MNTPIDVNPAELQRIGGKAAVLERLLQEDPTLPILPFSAHEATTPADSIVLDVLTHPQLSNADELITRSSSRYELDPRTSGLFASHRTDKEGLLEAILNVHYPGLKPADEMFLGKIGANYRLGEPIPVFIQEYKDVTTGVIAMHPHDTNMYLFSIWDFKNIYGRRSIFKKAAVGINRDGEMTNSPTMASNDTHYGTTIRRKIVDLYHRLLANNATDSAWSYQMEFGIEGERIWLYQWKPFLPLRKPTHQLPDETYLGQAAAGLSFGMLPEEGIELPVVRLPTAFGRRPSNLVQGTAKGFGENELERAAIEYWKTIRSPQGNPTLTNQDLAIEWGQKMGKQFKDGYCLLVPQINANMNIEKHLDDARVVVGLDYPALNVLDHGLTRVVTVFPNVLFGVDGTDFWDTVRTGDKVRIHSNGVDSIIYNPARTQ
jgi:hypothetical protein